MDTDFFQNYQYELPLLPGAGYGMQDSGINLRDD
jgi:hypothetical protein